MNILYTLSEFFRCLAEFIEITFCQSERMRDGSFCVVKVWSSNWLLGSTIFIGLSFSESEVLTITQFFLLLTKNLLTIRPCRAFSKKTLKNSCCSLSFSWKNQQLAFLCWDCRIFKRNIVSSKKLRGSGYWKRNSILPEWCCKLVLVIEKFGHWKTGDFPMTADESLCWDFLVDHSVKLVHLSWFLMIDLIFDYEKGE